MILLSSKFLRIYVVCIMCTLFLSASAQQTAKANQNTDTTKSSKWIIKVDPFVTVLTYALGPDADRVFSFAVERFISPHFSLQLTTWLQFYDFSFYNGPYLIYIGENAYFFAPQLKYYFSNSKKHKGLYAGIYGRFGSEVYSNYSIIQPEVYANYNFGGGVLAGVQYYIFKRLSIEAFFGIGEESYGKYNGQNPLGIVDINIGYIL